MPGEHRFFRTMSIVVAATVLAGFSNTYLPKVASGEPELPGIIHVHAVIFTAWLALFVTQTTLVASGRTAVHRRLGVFGVGLAALMLVVGVTTAITVARLDHRGIPGVEFPDAGGFLLLNLMSIMVFSVLVAAAWYYRHRPPIHKRLMLTATVGALVGPGVSRLPVASGRPPVIALLVLAFLFAGPVYDLATRRRVHPAYLGGVALALLGIPPVVAALAASRVWHTVAAWLMR
jgi:energy-converting hydrogenase Eha subunit A